MTAETKVRWTDNFYRREFVCGCGCGTSNVDPRLVNGLQAFRSWLGKPVGITSACRCPEWNGKVGGAKDSKHLSSGKTCCLAADARVEGMDSGALMKKMEEFDPRGVWFRGRGVYEGENFIHVDARAAVGIVRWKARQARAGGSGVKREYETVTKFDWSDEDGKAA